MKSGNSRPIKRSLTLLVFSFMLVLSMACSFGKEAKTATPFPPADASASGDIAVPSKTPQQTQASLLCEDPPPTELGLGQTVDGRIEDPVWTRCFWVMVPEGLDSIAFELAGMSSDLNLAVGYGFLVTLQYHVGEFWRSAESGTADEVLVIEDPTPGPYFISVRIGGIAGLQEPSSFTLHIHTEPERNVPALGEGLPDPGVCAAPAQEIAIGSTIDSELDPSDRDPLPRRYFCVQVPEGLDGLVIELTGLEGYLDLLVRRVRPSEWVDVSRDPDTRTLVIENPESGAYYIDIVGAFPGAGSPFTLSVRRP